MTESLKRSSLLNSAANELVKIAGLSETYNGYQ